MQCQGFGKATDTNVAHLAALLGIVLDGVTADIGLNCRPSSPDQANFCATDSIPGGMLSFGTPGPCRD